MSENRLRHLHMQHLHAPDHAAADTLPKRFGINTGLDAERESFGDRLRDRAIDHLMNQFADAARAQRTRMEDLIAEGAQNRFGAREDFFISADHDFMDTVSGARLAGGDRSVEHKSAFGAKERREPADERRRTR